MSLQECARLLSLLGANNTTQLPQVQQQQLVLLLVLSKVPLQSSAMILAKIKQITVLLLQVQQVLSQVFLKILA